MLLHHARRAARFTADGSLVPLAEQDRSRWDEHAIAEGVVVLQAALARDRLGEYQAQAAIAALHADARTAEETDWGQILEWYDELARLTDSPVVALNRAVAVAAVDGPLAGLRAVGAGAGRRTPPHRGARLPPRAGRRPGARPRPLRHRRRPGDIDRRARPPDPAGGAAARLSMRRPKATNVLKLASTHHEDSR